MFAEERFFKIKEIVDKRGSVTLPELVELLGTSESTVRRDLAEMDKGGLLTRVHGGAVSTEKQASIITLDQDLDSRRALNTEDKKKIGILAAQKIEPGDFVYIDAGSTTDFLADEIKETNATYVTNSYTVAKKLGKKNLKVIVLGGEFKSTTEAVVGVEAFSTLEKYNFTKGFFGTNGIDLKRGLTTPEEKEATIKSQAMSHTKEKFVLADGSKFGVISSIYFWGLEGTEIITSGTVPEEFEETSKKGKFKITKA